MSENFSFTPTQFSVEDRQQDPDYVELVYPSDTSRVMLFGAGSATDIFYARSRENGQLMGGLFIVPKTEGIAEIMYTVQQPYEQRGIATAMVQQALPILRNKGFKEAIAYVFPDSPSCRVLAKNGFIEDVSQAANGRIKMVLTL